MQDVATTENNASLADPTPGPATSLRRTPPQILGPFYPFMHTPVQGGDLTGGGEANGTILYLSGHVLTGDGKPVAGASVEIWQANAAGRYAHPNDTSSVPLDENFHGFAVTTTDTEGRYAFKTVRPAAYAVAPGHWRPAHIHFSVTGELERLVTQMYFKGEPHNDSDTWLNSAGGKDLLITDPAPVADKEPGAIAVTFDIVMANG